MRRSRRKDEKSQTDEKFSVHAPLRIRPPMRPACSGLRLRRTNARDIPQHGTAIDMPFDDQRLLETPSGAVLNLFVKNARQEARAVVQINHGLAEHAGCYAAFADFLAGRGFHVYAQDHRGHGGTKAQDALPGMFARRDGVRKVVADVACVHDLIARERPGLPVVLFGRSVGGLIALSFLREDAWPVAGMALWDYPEMSRFSARAARLLLAWERFRVGSDAPSRFLRDFMSGRAGEAREVPPLRPLRGHLSPTSVGERKGARRYGRPFLSPVERGRGGRRSRSEWGSTVAYDRTRAVAQPSPPDPLHGWPPTISLWSDVFAMGTELSKPGALARISRDLPLHLATCGVGSAIACKDAPSFPSPLWGEGGSHPISDFAAWIDRGVLET
jgi:pimeloyl-ACP methyl ester carboxylesterase